MSATYSKALFRFSKNPGIAPNTPSADKGLLNGKKVILRVVCLLPDLRLDLAVADILEEAT